MNTHNIGITPTIGRRVWYRPSVGERSALGVWDGGQQPLDAGICYVWNDRMVNLTIAGPDGKMHSRTSVKLLQPGEPVPEGMSYAEWMPYQTAQAAKAAPAA